MYNIKKSHNNNYNHYWKAILTNAMRVLTFWGLVISATSFSASIVVPSDPENMAVTAVKYPNEATRISWKNLSKPGGYTDQTITNFGNGDQRGILLVHSLEDIMNAARSFEILWNKNYPDDQRTISNNSIESFHEVFGDVFIEHYIEYIFSQRYLMSGSVVAYNDTPESTLGETFSPVNFILRVPAECIVVTSTHDAGTGVSYFPLSRTNGQGERENYGDQALEELQSLDAIVRYPGYAPYGEGWVANMNEIAFLTCAKDDSGNIYLPEVVGVFINNNKKASQFDFGNSTRNRNYIEKAITFANRKSLPVLIIEERQTSFPEQKFLERAGEWFKIKQSDNYNYFHSRFKNIIIPNKELQEKIDLLNTKRGEARKYFGGENYNYPSDYSEDIETKAREKVRAEFPELVREITDWNQYFKRKSQTFRMSPELLSSYGL